MPLMIQKTSTVFVSLGRSRWTTTTTRTATLGRVGGTERTRAVVATARGRRGTVLASGESARERAKALSGRGDGQRRGSQTKPKQRAQVEVRAMHKPMAMPTALVKEFVEGPLELATDEHRVLVLDVGYRTIDIVSWQRAVVLQMYEKVDVVAYYDGPWALSAEDAYYVPAVVRTREYSRHVSHKTPLVSLHRRNIFIRDGFRCQYCGTGDDLTVDHVVPASKGGPWTWENLTTACARCNNKKGDKLLSQSGLKLRSQPKAPTVANMCLYTRHGRFVNPPEEWVPFIPVDQIVKTHEKRKKANSKGAAVARCR